MLPLQPHHLNLVLPVGALIFKYRMNYQKFSLLQYGIELK